MRRLGRAAHLPPVRRRVAGEAGCDLAIRRRDRAPAVSGRLRRGNGHPTRRHRWGVLVLAILSPGVAGGGEAAVEIEGGADEGQVREGLKEVAEVLRLKPELLAVQPQVISVAEHLLEEEPRLVQVAHAGETLDMPEAAHRKGAFHPREPVGESVAEAIASHSPARSRSRAGSRSTASRSETRSG